MIGGELRLGSHVVDSLRSRVLQPSSVDGFLLIVLAGLRRCVEIDFLHFVTSLAPSSLNINLPIDDLLDILDCRFGLFGLFG